MRYGVFSDLHANYQALRVVLDKFREENVEGYIFCGDLVGYGPSPQACVQTVKKLPNLAIVMGNHDKALTDPAIITFFTPDSIIPIMLANREMTSENFKFMSTLPEKYLGTEFSIVHGTFFDPYKEYLLTPRQFKDNAAKWPGNVCFVGHSHIPFIMRSQNGGPAKIELFPSNSDTEVQLYDDSRYMINPGSVGQPRDENPRASAGIFDSDKNTFKLIRAEYDVKETQRKMAEKNFPQRLIDRIALGL
ncbi:putative phosphodiesterase [Elusimicrobium simillimum]|uniref:metallophosphoesterase family protein n=1 Tax=Elusimicrobium simillimum TaxID=3143438 RepID=UPI003C6F711E